MARNNTKKGDSIPAPVTRTKALLQEADQDNLMIGNSFAPSYFRSLRRRVAHLGWLIRCSNSAIEAITSLKGGIVSKIMPDMAS
jgi:hypothetical protein